MTNINKRPWQGTLLAWLNIIMLIGVIVGTILGLYTFLVAFVISQVAKIAAQFLGVFPIVLATAFIMVIVLTLIIKGLFSGSRLAIIISTLGTLFNIFMSIINIFRSLLAGNFQAVGLTFIGIIIASFVLWLQLSCLKHPFYGGNGRINLDSFKFWQKRARRSDEMTTF